MDNQQEAKKKLASYKIHQKMEGGQKTWQK